MLRIINLIETAAELPGFESITEHPDFAWHWCRSGAKEV
jgi:hypothetical protein